MADTHRRFAECSVFGKEFAIIVDVDANRLGYRQAAVHDVEESRREVVNVDCFSPLRVGGRLSRSIEPPVRPGWASVLCS
jgi:hypothetical protein